MGIRPPRRRNLGCWILAGVIGLTLCTALPVGGVLYFVFREVADSRDVTADYFDAVMARDWARAHSHLDTSSRAGVTPDQLQARWARRESLFGGPVVRFDMDRNFSMRNDSASVGGTIHYQGGRTQSWSVLLVKEDGIWKVARLPD